MSEPEVQVDLMQVRCELARRSFWEYLKLKDPKFYTEKRWHLKEFADLLQDFYQNKLITPSGKIAKILIINLPPRMGKSYTLTNFCSWVLGLSWSDNDRATEKIITVSYNDDMAQDFSRYCRDNIIQEKIDPDDIVFQDIFFRYTKSGIKQTCKIMRGDGGAKKWALAGEFFNYLGAGFKGQITGKGASIGIIDDPIKNREEAYNENTLEYIWNFYKNTFRSRIESGGKQIINHTRWREQDLAGRITELYGDDVYTHKRSIVENAVWKTVEKKDENGRVISSQQKLVGGDLLCEELANWEDVEDFLKTIDMDIVMANYFQEPADVRGRLYQSLQTYRSEELPEGPRITYVDTADTGDDYFSAFAFVESGRYAYIIDCMYTIEDMTVTEPELARMLHLNRVNECKVESNSGGRSYSRAVEKELELLGNKGCIMSPFSQSKNKITRILTQSAYVQKHVLFPEGWEHRWPLAWKALTMYQKEGKNKHDDAPDAITGVAEHFQPAGGMPIFNPGFKPRKKSRGRERWQAK
jgi:predicted phage terminase large subunit-like protein